LVSVQDRSTVCTKRAIASETVLDAPDGILGDLGHVESPSGPFGDSVSFGARYVHGLRQTYHRLRNCFGCIGWYSWVTRVKWKLVLVYLETVLVLVHDRCTDCAKCTIASEIILDAPDGTPR
jgi:hypothetical protein